MNHDPVSRLIRYALLFVLGILIGIVHFVGPTIWKVLR
jgi:hypothetical protein